MQSQRPTLSHIHAFSWLDSLGPHSRDPCKEAPRCSCLLAGRFCAQSCLALFPVPGSCRSPTTPNPFGLVFCLPRTLSLDSLAQFDLPSVDSLWLFLSLVHSSPGSGPWECHAHLPRPCALRRERGEKQTEGGQAFRSACSVRLPRHLSPLSLQTGDGLER